MRTAFYSFAPLVEQSLNGGDSDMRRLVAVYQEMLVAYASLLEKYEDVGYSGYNLTEGHDSLRAIFMTWRTLPDLIETVFLTATDPKRVDLSTTLSYVYVVRSIDVSVMTCHRM